MARSNLSFGSINDLNLQGRTLLNANHTWQGDTSSTGASAGVSVAYGAGDIVVHNDQIYIARVTNDNIEPGSADDSAFDSGSGAWTLISDTVAPFRSSDLPAGDGDYELQNTNGTYSWILAGSTAGNDVQSIAIPGSTAAVSIPLFGPQTITFDETNNETRIIFSDSATAQMFYNASTYTETFVRNSLTVARVTVPFTLRNLDGVERNVGIGTVIRRGTSGDTAIFEGINLQDLRTSSTLGGANLALTPDFTFRGNVGFESLNAGRIRFSRNGNNIQFDVDENGFEVEIRGFPYPISTPDTLTSSSTQVNVDFVVRPDVPQEVNNRGALQDFLLEAADQTGISNSGGNVTTTRDFTLEVEGTLYTFVTGTILTYYGINNRQSQLTISIPVGDTSSDPSASVIQTFGVAIGTQVNAFIVTDHHQVTRVTAGANIAIDTDGSTSIIRADIPSPGSTVIPNVTPGATDEVLRTVNIDGDIYDIPQPVTNFIDLDDTPSAYPTTFNPNQVLVPRAQLNQTTNTPELEFTDINSFLDESQPETIESQFTGLSSQVSEAHPHVIDFDPPTGWNHFGQLATFTLNNVPSFNRNGFLSRYLNGRWDEYQHTSGSNIGQPNLFFIRVENTANNAATVSIRAESEYNADADGDGNIGLVYRRSIGGNNWIYAVPVASNSVDRLGDLVNNFTIEDSVTTRIFPTWDLSLPTADSNVRWLFLINRNNPASELIATTNLNENTSTYAYGLLSDSFLVNTNAETFSPYNSNAVTVSSDVYLQLIDRVTSPAVDAVHRSGFISTNPLGSNTPISYNISYANARRGTVHAPDSRNSVGSDESNNGPAVRERTSFSWLNTFNEVETSFPSADRNLIQEIVNYVNGHTSTIGVQHIGTGNTHLTFIPGNTSHTSGAVANDPNRTHDGVVRLSFTGLTGGSRSRAKQGIRSTQTDNNPMIYMNTIGLVWALTNIRDVNNNSWTFLVRRVLDRTSFGSFNTSNGSDCGFEYPVELLAGWMSHLNIDNPQGNANRRNPFTTTPRTWAQALAAQVPGGLIQVVDNLAEFRFAATLGGTDLATSANDWDAQITRNFGNTGDGATNFGIHEAVWADGGVSALYQANNPVAYASRTVYDGPLTVPSDTATRLAQFTYNIDGYDGGEDFFAADRTVVMPDQVRHVGGIPLDSANSAYATIASDLVNVANGLSPTSTAQNQAYQNRRSTFEHWAYTTEANTDASTASHTLKILTDNAPDPVGVPGIQFYLGLNIIEVDLAGDADTTYDTNSNGTLATTAANSTVTASGSNSTRRDTLEITYSPYTANLVNYETQQAYSAGQRVSAARDTTDPESQVFQYVALQNIPATNTVHPSVGAPLWRQETQIYTQDFPDNNMDWDSSDVTTRVNTYGELVYGLGFENTFYTSRISSTGILVHATNPTIIFIFDQSSEVSRFITALNLDANGNPMATVPFNWYRNQSVAFLPSGADVTITTDTNTDDQLPRVIFTFRTNALRDAFANEITTETRGSDELIALGDRIPFERAFDTLVAQNGEGFTLQSRVEERHPVPATARIISGPNTNVPDRRSAAATLRFADGFPQIFVGRSNAHGVTAILENLNDVSIDQNTIANGQSLTYDNGTWTNGHVQPELVNFVEDGSTRTIQLRPSDTANFEDIGVNDILSIGADRQETQLAYTGTLSSGVVGRVASLRFVDTQGPDANGFGFIFIIDLDVQVALGADIVINSVATYNNNEISTITRRGVISAIANNLRASLSSSIRDLRFGTIPNPFTSDIMSVGTIIAGSTATTGVGDTFRIIWNSGATVPSIAGSSTYSIRRSTTVQYTFLGSDITESTVTIGSTDHTVWDITISDTDATGTFNVGTFTAGVGLLTHSSNLQESDFQIVETNLVTSSNIDIFYTGSITDPLELRVFEPFVPVTATNQQVALEGIAIGSTALLDLSASTTQGNGEDPSGVDGQDYRIFTQQQSTGVGEALVEIIPQEFIGNDDQGVAQFRSLTALVPNPLVTITTGTETPENIATQLSTQINTNFGDLGYEATATSGTLSIQPPLGRRVEVGTTISQSPAGTLAVVETTPAVARSNVNFTALPTYRNVPLLSFDFASVPASTRLAVNADQTGVAAAPIEFLQGGRQDLGFPIISDVANVQDLAFPTDAPRTSSIVGGESLPGEIRSAALFRTVLGPNGFPTVSYSFDGGPTPTLGFIRNPFTTYDQITSFDTGTATNPGEGDILRVQWTDGVTVPTIDTTATYSFRINNTTQYTFSGSDARIGSVDVSGTAHTTWDISIANLLDTSGNAPAASTFPVGALSPAVTQFGILTDVVNTAAPGRSFAGNQVIEYFERLREGARLLVRNTFLDSATTISTEYLMLLQNVGANSVNVGSQGRTITYTAEIVNSWDERTGSRLGLEDLPSLGVLANSTVMIARPFRPVIPDQVFTPSGLPTNNSVYELQVMDGNYTWVDAAGSTSGLPASPTGEDEYQLSIDSTGNATWTVAPDIPTAPSAEAVYELNVDNSGTATWVEATDVFQPWSIRYMQSGTSGGVISKGGQSGFTNVLAIAPVSSQVQTFADFGTPVPWARPANTPAISTQVASQGVAGLYRIDAEFVSSGAASLRIVFLSGRTLNTTNTLLTHAMGNVAATSRGSGSITIPMFGTGQAESFIFQLGTSTENITSLSYSITRVA